MSTTPTTRSCAAWRGCGNTAVPVSDISFRGFCPDCERVASSGSICCVEACGTIATRTLGREVYFPVCDKHAEVLA
jgi:hypothetical protein